MDDTLMGGSISSGTLRNVESARVSIPTQLTQVDGKYIWRTDLFKSEPFWKGRNAFHGVIGLRVVYESVHHVFICQSPQIIVVGRHRQIRQRAHYRSNARQVSVGSPSCLWTCCSGRCKLLMLYLSS